MSFNVNGIRARQEGLLTALERFQPDILGIQETKVADDQFPEAVFAEAGYHLAYHGQKTHYGVALFSRLPTTRISKGFPEDAEDAQRRLITGRFSLLSGKELTVINGYFPQGESRDHPVKFPAKRKFYEDLNAYLAGFDPNENLVVMGDFNIAPEDADVGIGEANAKRWLKTGKSSFLPEEREWFGRLMEWGFQDSFRLVNPHIEDRFSWFDYRSRGFEAEPKRGLRIDFVLVSQPLAGRCRDAVIDYELRGGIKPSDHCPVWVDLDL